MVTDIMEGVSVVKQSKKTGLLDPEHRGTALCKIGICIPNNTA
jgi:hypothetical protein